VTAAVRLVSAPDGIVFWWFFYFVPAYLLILILIDGLLPTCVALPIFNFSMLVVDFFPISGIFMLFTTLPYHLLIFFLIFDRVLVLFLIFFLFYRYRYRYSVLVSVSSYCCSTWGEYCGVV